MSWCPASPSCFTGDTVFEVAQGRAEPFGRLTRVVAEQGDPRRHLIGNVIVDEPALSVVTVAADGLSLGAGVLCTARLRREQDGCRRFGYFFVGMGSCAGTKPTAGEK
ncbi:hypothetical protein [Streptomyces sp. NPDC127119]|uniref:hypothetical protein n=1 Tax=Streptomyces sp. NPDC127119 TaxID=3345370 RepID=UPI00362F0A41